MGFPNGQARVERAKQVMGELRWNSGLIGIVGTYDRRLARGGGPGVGRMCLAGDVLLWILIPFAKLSSFLEGGRLPRPQPAG